MALAHDTPDRTQGEAARTRAEVERFTRTWQGPGGFWGWLTAVNNQPLGLRFMVTSLSFFAAGGVLALLMRIQLAVSDNNFLGPQVYNQFFTMHGSTMMYLFAVPFLEGLALYVLPLALGSRDVAFPRLTALSYWTYLFGGLLFYASFVVGSAPDVGWFGYTPLSGPRYSGIGTDFWLLGLALVEIAGIGAGAELAVTVLKLRAPGMAINRMPLFAWAFLTAGVMILFAFPVLLTATLLLELDRNFGMSFFDARGGGDNLLWQHLFWFFGHPEVYIIFIPATGVVSMVVAAAARRISAYTLIVIAMVLTGFVSFGLWVHHMYTTGLPELSLHFFAAASLMIAVASGVQVFAWIASLWGTRPALRVPLLYVLGFVFVFVIGGMTGVMVAVVPFDWQVHDTYFVVAHFHYVLIGGALFPILAGLCHWLPKMTGRMLNEALGKWSFWMIFLGFNAAFFPMHIMGFLGLPRRVYTYPRALGLDGMNLLATVGAFLMGLGLLLFLVDFLRSLLRGERAGDNPWGADSLEWSVSSPPPVYGFYSPPVVSGRHPLWDQGSLDQGTEPMQRARRALTAAPADWRATVSTEMVDGRPLAVQYLPGSTVVPFLAAVGLTVGMVGVLTQAYLVGVAGGVFAVGALARWLWPDEKVLARLRASKVGEEAGLPIFATGTRSVPWWGAVSLLAVLGTALATLVYCYFFLRTFSAEWPQGGLGPPELPLAAAAFALLLGAGAAHGWAARGFRAGSKGRIQWGLAAALAMGALFVVLFSCELAGLALAPADAGGFTPQDHAYGSAFFVLAGTLLVLVAAGLPVTVAAQLRMRREHADREGFAALQMQITGLYWYFLVGAGAVVFATLYLSPRLLG